MPKITNEQKLEAIKGFLRENNIVFKENHVNKRCGVDIPLLLPDFQIAVRIGDDQDFYKKTKGIFYPIFIRDTDTKKKVLEKVQNTIIKSMRHQQKMFIRKEETQ